MATTRVHLVGPHGEAELADVAEPLVEITLPPLVELGSLGALPSHVHWYDRPGAHTPPVAVAVFVPERDCKRCRPAF